MDGEEVAIAVEPRALTTPSSEVTSAKPTMRRNGTHWQQTSLPLQRILIHAPHPSLLRCHSEADHEPPVEALRDMQTSISLNDNRAVYRSHLPGSGPCRKERQPWKDLPTTMGFQPWPWWRGGNQSMWTRATFLPIASCRHLSALPRHEIARVSELLQSQLLQPINITPLQPHLSQNNLLLLGGEGP